MVIEREEATIAMEPLENLLRSLAVLSSLLVAGCATVANQHTARPISADGRPSAGPETASGITISGEELEELSSRNFGVLAVTFQNPTNDWIKIESVHLDFGSEAKNKSIFVPWGEEIVSWELATSQRIAIERANTTTALSILAIGGSLAAGLGRRSVVGAVGGLVALGSVAALWGKALEENATAATFPHSHLFATPFSVPPGLFAKKWVLLNGPKTAGTGCITSVNMDYEVAGQGSERVYLRFSRTGSDWHRAACLGPG